MSTSTIHFLWVREKKKDGTLLREYVFPYKIGQGSTDMLPFSDCPGSYVRETLNTGEEAYYRIFQSVDNTEKKRNPLSRIQKILGISDYIMFDRRRNGIVLRPQVTPITPRTPISLTKWRRSYYLHDLETGLMYPTKVIQRQVI
jgi:hypothetical protein